MTKKLDVGGQAVIEGVMMRGPRSMVIAVRRADGSIAVKDSEWVPLVERLKFLKWPLLRGATVMVESLVNGMQALSFSADLAMQDEEAAKKAEEAEAAEAAGVTNLDAERAEGDDAEEDSGSSVMTKGAIALSLTISLALGIGLFIYIPHGVAAAIFNLAGGQPLATEAPVEMPLFHLLVGVIKMAIFIGYISLIRRMHDIRRVFQYHGAEHKSIHVYEAGEELTVDNARKWPTFHPRCGTSFLVFVIIISIGVFAGAFPLIEPFLPALEGWKLNLLQASIKIPLMIPIAGLSYEFIKWAGKRGTDGFMGVLSMPGRLVQKLTTIEPDDEQLEVALVSLKRALEQEGTLTDPEYVNCTFLPAAS